MTYIGGAYTPQDIIRIQEFIRMTYFSWKRLIRDNPETEMLMALPNITDFIRKNLTAIKINGEVLGKFLDCFFVSINKTDLNKIASSFGNDKDKLTYMFDNDTRYLEQTQYPIDTRKKYTTRTKFMDFLYTHNIESDLNDYLTIAYNDAIYLHERLDSIMSFIKDIKSKKREIMVKLKENVPVHVYLRVRGGDNNQTSSRYLFEESRENPGLVNLTWLPYKFDLDPVKVNKDAIVLHNKFWSERSQKDGFPYDAIIHDDGTTDDNRRPTQPPGIFKYELGPFANYLAPGVNMYTNVEQYFMPILTQLKNNKDVFVIGYGASGSGKTSSLIYFKGDGKRDNGILVNIVNALDCLSLSVDVTEFYVNENEDKANHSPYDDSRRSKNVDVLKGCVFSRNSKNKAFMVDQENRDHIVTYVDNKKPSTTTLNDVVGNNYELGPVLSTLIDDLNYRHIYATTNNPVSSRSHVLITIKFEKGPYMFIADYAGIENEFLCDNVGELVKLANIKDIRGDANERFYNRDRVNKDLSRVCGATGMGSSPFKFTQVHPQTSEAMPLIPATDVIMPSDGAILLGEEYQQVLKTTYKRGLFEQSHAKIYANQKSGCISLSDLRPDRKNKIVDETLTSVNDNVITHAMHALKMWYTTEQETLVNISVCGNEKFREFASLNGIHYEFKTDKQLSLTLWDLETLEYYKLWSMGTMPGPDNPFRILNKNTNLRSLTIKPFFNQEETFKTCDSVSSTILLEDCICFFLAMNLSFFVAENKVNSEVKRYQTNVELACTQIKTNFKNDSFVLALLKDAKLFMGFNLHYDATNRIIEFNPCKKSSNRIGRWFHGMMATKKVPLMDAIHLFKCLFRYRYELCMKSYQTLVTMNRVCSCRRMEGKMINATLKTARTTIQSILDYKMRNRLTYYPSISESYYKQTCHPVYGPCYGTKEISNSKPYDLQSSIIGEYIVDKIVQRQNTLPSDGVSRTLEEKRHKAVDDMMLVVFGVFNASLSDTSRPPSQLYINTQELVYEARRHEGMKEIRDFASIMPPTNPEVKAMTMGISQNAVRRYRAWLMYWKYLITNDEYKKLMDNVTRALSVDLSNGGDPIALYNAVKAIIVAQEQYNAQHPIGCLEYLDSLCKMGHNMLWPNDDIKITCTESPVFGLSAHKSATPSNRPRR